MKNLIFVLALALGFWACNKSDEVKIEENETVAMTLAEFQTIDESFENKEIELSGIVSHVCRHSGKKMFIVDENNNKVKLVVTDEVPMFDMNYEGSTVTIKGLVNVEKLDEAYLAEWEKEVGNTADCAEESEMKTAEINVEDGMSEEEIEAQKQMAKIKEMRQEMLSNGKGYIPVYTIKCNSVKEVKS